MQATKLVEDLPEALAKHEAGELNTAQARAIAEATMPLDRQHCSEVLERVLPRAGQQTLTEFKNSVTRAVHRVDPRTAQKKHEDDTKRRDVSVRALPNGMAGIWSEHTAVDAEAIMARINAVAAKHTAGDDRLVGERRADAMANLILGVDCPEQQTAHGRRTTVTIVVPLATATGASICRVSWSGSDRSLPAGWRNGPQTTAQGAVAGSSSRSVVGTGPPTEERGRGGCDGRRPRQRARTRPQQPTEARAHRDNFDGTNTTRWNLHALCCRHHHLKTETDWRVTRTTHGTTVWTSPTGRTYRKPPDHLPGYNDTRRSQDHDAGDDDPDPP